MECESCGAELPENPKYCPECGAQIKDIKDKLVDSNNKDNKKLYIVFGIIAIIVVIIIIINSVSGFGKFKRFLRKGEHEKAEVFYSDNIRGNNEREKEAKEFLLKEINNIWEDFKSGKIDYDGAIKKLKPFSQYEVIGFNAKDTIGKIEMLDESKSSFKKAQEYLKSKEYGKALQALDKVIKEDENYETAQKQIKENTDLFKNSVINTVDEYLDKEDFDKALETLDTALKYFKEDEDLIVKKEIVEENQMEELKNNQELSVVSANIVFDILDNELAEVVVKNNTDKVIKEYTVGFMGYDKDGYPIKTGWLQSDYLNKGIAEDNVQPGQTAGKGAGWELSNKYVKTVLACVESVKYYNDSVWDNPYYDYWVKEYLEKPLEK